MLDCEWISFWTANHHKQTIALSVLDSQRKGERSGIATSSTSSKTSSPLPSRANFGLSIFEVVMASGKSIMPQQLCGSFYSGTVNSGIPPDEAKKKPNEKQQQENKHMTCRRDGICINSLLSCCLQLQINANQLRCPFDAYRHMHLVARPIRC